MMVILICWVVKSHGGSGTLGLQVANERWEGKEVEPSDSNNLHTGAETPQQSADCHCDGSIRVKGDPCIEFR